MNTKRLTKLLALVLALVMSLAVLTACPKPDPEQGWTPSKTLEDDGKNYTYNTYLTLSPTNWNELTYQDNNDTNIMSYIGSSFFSYDYKFDADGNPIPGDFTTTYSAATKLEDVTAQYKDAWNLPGDKNYAWKITLREDLAWENGDHITAEDFVYTMKEQLNPLFLNYRADSFYAGSVNLVGAKNYVKQGQSGTFSSTDVYTEYSADIDAQLVFSVEGAAKEDGPITYVRDWLEGDYGAYIEAGWTGAELVSALFGTASADAIAALEGKTLAEIKADETLNATWTAVLGAWQTEPNEELHFFLTDYAFPATSWDSVGIFVGDNEYEIVVVLTKPLPLLKEDGSLSYQAAYNMSSLPLVHKATYEANKVAPVEGSSLWTSKYNSNVATTMSWGPYRLADFQEGKQHTLVRNEYWYGYGLEENKGLYLTDKIVCDIVTEYQVALSLFKAGKLDGIGIDATVADQYKNSERAYFTPDDYVGSLQVQSSATELRKRSTEDASAMLLLQPEFRQALSLAINRSDYAGTCTTSSLAGYGLFTSVHYYDVENGGAYRETDEARKVLCEVYGVDYTQYPSLEAAADSITGYDVEQARALVEVAVANAIEKGDITANTKHHFIFGSGTVNEATSRHFNYLTKAWQDMFVGTSLEGKVTFELSEQGSTWANDFRNGEYDFCMGGWTGAAWDPGYFLLAYLSPDYMYSKAWDTSGHMMTFTMKGVGENGADVTETMSLMAWYSCLNGATDAKYDWSSNALEESQRLQLIAALEQEILKQYYTLPTYYSFGASLISYKWDYISYEYNTFMAYGGLKYAKYNFTDEEWAAEVEKNGGEIDYTA